MKKFKKLIPAFCMLLVSAIMLGSSTFAWFSMNNRVSATDMTVTAKSDQTFMIIAAGETTAAEAQETNATSVKAQNQNAEILPSAHKDTVTDITTADTVGNWYYKHSTKPDTFGGAGNETEETALTTFTGYVLVNTFTVTVAKGANAMKDIKVETCTISTNGQLAVKALVATATAVEEFSVASKEGSTVLQASLTDATVMIVKVYIYLDGTNTHVFTNNIANLKSTTVSVTFTGTVVA